MNAWLLESVIDLTKNSLPLRFTEIEVPRPKSDEVLIKIHTCGVCHTEIDEIEGRTPPPVYPVVPGHQVVGSVAELGEDCQYFSLNDRVGVAWIHQACKKCPFCLKGFENLCPGFIATGRDVNGGYAEYMVVKEDFAHPLPANLSNSEVAPLLCAGAIGYRSLSLTQLNDGQTIGLTGFGGSGHLVLKMVKHRFPQSEIFVFARSRSEQTFALELGANWVGNTTDKPPVLLDAIIDTTPVWKPVIEALDVLRPGGRLVINAIRKENHDLNYLQNLHYPKHLWMEKEIKSVANVTRKDVRYFLELAGQIPIKPTFQEFPLEDANQAILELKNRKIRGSKVLVME